MKTAIIVIVIILGTLACAVTLLIGWKKYAANQEEITKTNLTKILENTTYDKEVRLKVQGVWQRDQVLPYFLFAVTPLTILGIALVSLGRGMAGGVILLLSTIGPPALLAPAVSVATEAEKQGIVIPQGKTFWGVLVVSGLNFVAGVLSFFVKPKERNDEDDRSRRRQRDEEEYDRPRRRRSEEDDEDDRPPRRPRDEEDDEDDRPRRRRRNEDEQDEDRPRRRRDEQEEPPRPRRRREPEDYDEEESSRRRRRDDFDDDEEPPRRRKRR
ncbi:MAG: hypothetical protein ACFCD0_21215 [Gemmataceae bacterium]